ncbi:type II toxin-antitoxin system HicB family antitoxin [Synechocystis sp. PCC 7339]|uniref:type II toxin-antitoxin system HicB family antitoxin n=1 Tax=unclassified Synechocystis TaxID=2640012 RepID=UPI001BAECBB2|nr:MULTISPECIES: type II toxin-antitoxin system HicB family antitoxin [unclassified Synechocystis]QUS59952.1 type II toxin-antitoxin system HicB family antitoxin [Synechocystis sp. PCC 7338]UAJ72591.1 type II toxin-antitoxin system HicB family antitoxin [Synechocystis sp. PCC 7339]
MNIKAIIHGAEEGGYWAGIPIFSGCYTQGETMEEVMANLKKVISLYLEVKPEKISQADKIVELIL